MKLFKKVFLIGGTLAIALVILGVVSISKAEAVTCTANADGAWAAEGTWDDADCGAAHAPVAGDVVVIPTGRTVSVGAAAAAASVAVTGTLNIGAFTLTTTTGSTVPAGGVISIAAGGTLISPATDIAGEVTNAGTLTAATSLTGAGSLSNAATGTLNIGGTSTIATLTATAAGNTVNYNGAGQTVKATTYYNLGLSGGVKVINGVTVANDLNIATGASGNLTGDSATAYLKFNGTMQSASTWGFTGSGARHIETTYITAGTGKITATYGSEIATANPEPITVTYTNGVPSTSSSSSESSSTPIVKVTIATEEVATGCSGGNLFNSQTGKPCTNNTGITSKKVYALGHTTLKVGSKSEAVKELQKALGVTPVTGYFGQITKAKVIEWQKSHGLKGDGVVGSMTKVKINE